MPEAARGVRRVSRPVSPPFAELGGVLAAFVVEGESGTVTGHAAVELGFDGELAALQAIELLRAAQTLADAVEPADRLQSMVFVLGTQQHVLVPSRRVEGRYLFLVLEKSAESLGRLYHRLSTAGF